MFRLQRFRHSQHCKLSTLKLPQQKSSPTPYIVGSLIFLAGATYVTYKVEVDPEFSGIVESKVPPAVFKALDPARNAIRPYMNKKADKLEIAATEIPVKNATKVVEEKVEPVVIVEAAVEREAKETAVENPTYVVEELVVTPVETPLPSSPSQHVAAPVTDVSEGVFSPAPVELAPPKPTQSSSPELSFLQELDHLDNATLRSRVYQLASELIDRTKWEAIRLQQSMKQIEADLNQYYSAQLSKQREELQREFDKAQQAIRQNASEEVKQQVTEAQEKLDERLQTTLKAQAEGFAASLKDELVSQAHRLHEEANVAFQSALNSVREEQIEQTMPVLKDLENIRAQLIVYEAAADSIGAARSNIRDVHTRSAATLALTAALSEDQPVYDQIQILARACKNDEVIGSILAVIPAETALRGVPSVAELRCRFPVVKSNILRASLAPKSVPPFVGNLIGSLLSAVSWVPSGYVSGDRVEERLARIAYLLEFGDLATAVKEIETMEGSTREAASEWEALAKSRLAADQAVVALKAIAALRHVQLANV